MFVVRAHTFILQARLAISLAWVAGYTNIIALIVCGYVVSHVTGHASVLGRRYETNCLPRASLQVNQGSKLAIKPFRSVWWCDMCFR